MTTAIDWNNSLHQNDSYLQRSLVNYWHARALRYQEVLRKVGFLLPSRGDGMPIGGPVKLQSREIMIGYEPPPPMPPETRKPPRYQAGPPKK